MIYSLEFTSTHKGRKNHYSKFLLFQLMYLEHGDKLILTSAPIHNHFLAQFTLRICRTEMRCIKTAHTSRIVLFTGPMEGRSLRLWLRHLPADPGPQRIGRPRGAGAGAWRPQKGGWAPKTAAACFREGVGVLKNNFLAYRPRQAYSRGRGSGGGGRGACY